MPEAKTNKCFSQNVSQKNLMNRGQAREQRKKKTDDQCMGIFVIFPYQGTDDEPFQE